MVIEINKVLISGGEEIDKGGAWETFSGALNVLYLDRCVGYTYTFIKAPKVCASHCMQLCLTKIIRRE